MGLGLGQYQWTCWQNFLVWEYVLKIELAGCVCERGARTNYRFGVCNRKERVNILQLGKVVEQEQIINQGVRESPSPQFPEEFVCVFFLRSASSVFVVHFPKISSIWNGLKFVEYLGLKVYIEAYCTPWFPHLPGRWCFRWEGLNRPIYWLLT